MLLCPAAAAVKGKVKNGCKWPSGQSLHCLLWKCILSLQDWSLTAYSSLAHNATGVCVCAFLWQIASVAVAMWGTNRDQCLTLSAHWDRDIINWRKLGFYWQRSKVHIVSIELQAGVSSSFLNAKIQFSLVITWLLFLWFLNSLIFNLGISRRISRMPPLPQLLCICLLLVKGL